MGSKRTSNDSGVGKQASWQTRFGHVLASILPQETLIGLTDEVCRRDPNVLLQALGPYLNRSPNLDNMPVDFPLQRPVQFEMLAGLFASTSLNHGVISMPIRQTAYIFGLIRQMKPRKAIEVGRYKGGSTIVIASAMDDGELWSIDLGDKEQRLQTGESHRPYTVQVGELCKRLGLNVHLINGDSRTVEVDTGEVDVVFIDGDHSYEGVRNDFDRFGRRVCMGGAVLFDDAFPEEMFPAHTDTVGRLIREAEAEGRFKLVSSVNRLAHLERIR